MQRDEDLCIIQHAWYRFTCQTDGIFLSKWDVLGLNKRHWGLRKVCKSLLRFSNSFNYYIILQPQALILPDHTSILVLH